MLLASENNGKVHLMLMITDDLVKIKKLNAANLINEISSEINGGGGGQANFATAGGINTYGINKALEKVILLISYRYLYIYINREKLWCSGNL